MKTVIDMLYNEHDLHLVRLEKFESILLDGDILKLKEATEELKFELELHFKEEEEALFPKFLEIYGDFPPVNCMLSEHKEMRDTLCDMAEYNFEEFGIENFSKMFAYLKATVLNHIEKENNVLFNMAKSSISTQNLEMALLSAREVRERFSA